MPGFQLGTKPSVRPSRSKNAVLLGTLVDDRKLREQRYCRYGRPINS